MGDNFRFIIDCKKDENNEFHCLDGPARVWHNGTKEWWLHGKRHRLNEPAIIRIDGTEEWWLDGKRHRTNGPALVDLTNTHTWREEWWQNGQLHRKDGPALIGNNGLELWWINDKNITEELKISCIEFDINPNYKEWTDSEKIWFRLWASQF